MNTKILVAVLIGVGVLGGIGLLYVSSGFSREVPAAPSVVIEDADAVIEITDNGFEPREVTIQKGQVVAWVNRGTGYYWPASNIHPTHEIYPEFDPRRPLEPGEVWSFRFEKSGTWQFHDHLRPSRTGTIAVE